MLIPIPGLPAIDDSWLSECDAGRPPPLSRLLPSSLFYAGAGTDLRPVQNLWGNIASFVHCDIGISAEEVEATLRNPGVCEGFELVFLRRLAAADLGVESLATLCPPNLPEAEFRHVANPPFAWWGVYRLRSGKTRTPIHPGFSLLHISGDAAATYRALYRAGSAVPRILAVIQPDARSESLCQPWGDLAQAVLEPSPELGLLRAVASAGPRSATEVLDPPPVRPRFLLTNISRAHQWRTVYSHDLTAMARLRGLSPELEIWQMPDERMPTPDFEALRKADEVSRNSQETKILEGLRDELINDISENR